MAQQLLLATIHLLLENPALGWVVHGCFTMET